MASEFHQYSGIKSLMGTPAAWIADPMEALRIGSYGFYERLYWTEEGTLKLTQRGSEDKPIYIPAPKVVVETLHRYLAPQLEITSDPAFGTPQEQELAKQVMTDLMRREKYLTKFQTNKRFGLIRGDAMWLLYADPVREPGSMISILELDPAKVFRIEDPENADTVIGYHIVEEGVSTTGKPGLRRTTYRKTTMLGGPSPITVEEALFEIDEWGGPGMAEEDAKIIEVIRPAEVLPAPIDDLPIYHTPNFRGSTNWPWGSSELRGMERLFGAINQGISDEDLALALDGLGVYATTAGTPIDEETGEERPWNLGPGRVIELPDSEKKVTEVFARVTGVQSNAPYQEHLKYLHEQVDLSAGTPSVAKGIVEVKAAESGIALAIQFAPMTARAEERESGITDTQIQMLYNLPKWFIAYEGGAFNGLLNQRWIPKYGPKLPRNQDAEVKELLALHGATPKILPSAYIRDRLRKLNYEDMPDEATIEAAITAENEASLAQAQAAFGAETGAEQGRVDAELGKRPVPPSGSSGSPADDE